MHLTDFHFGTEPDGIVQNLLQIISELKPDLAVLSGDFTQIASEKEFKKAADFIKQLSLPAFCVPGNHDIPRFNLIERFLNPYKKYKAYIDRNLSPVFANDMLVMTGLNTARRCLLHWNWANGSISGRQLSFLRNSYQNAGPRYRICVLHHPIQKAEKAPLKVTVFGAARAMKEIKDMKVDLVLTGHVHYASLTVESKTIFASASTAISRRLRTHENGFNVIDLDESGFDITHFIYENNRFAPSSKTRFPKQAH